LKARFVPFGALVFALAQILFGGCATVTRGASNTSADSEVKHCQIQSRIPGDSAKRALSVYLPEDYRTSRASYPVLYLIHGDDGNNLTFLGGGYGGLMSDANVSVIVDRLIQEGRIKPLIVACPEVGDVIFSEEYLSRDIVSFVDGNFRTIRNRESRAIAGHSSGGDASLYVALAHPEVFSNAGGFSSSSDGLEVLSLRLGELVKAHNQKSPPIRFWLYAGTNDQNGVTGPNRDFVAALKENDFPTEYIEDDGDHISKVAQRLGEYIEFAARFLKW
jgi:enterochelin esterase-like enzyme